MKVLLLDGHKNSFDKISKEVSKKYSCEKLTNYESINKRLNANKSTLLIMSLEAFEKAPRDYLIQIKEQDKNLSVVIITKKSGDKDAEINALNMGADDFIVNPFFAQDQDSSLRIFLARVEARLRSGGTNVIEINDLKIDPDEEKIFYHSKEIELKGKPFEVLTHLAKHRGQIVSKEQLLDAIWEEPELVTPNVIEVAINQIRQKMDKPLGIGTIETVRRRGYRFCFPNCSEESTMVDA